MKLNELAPAKGSKTARKRRGRGPGSGNGTYAGRGLKGQNARSGGGVRPGFEGGQMPIHRRLPKRGFTHIFKKTYAVINVADLARFDAGAVIDEASLIATGLVKGRRDGRRDGVKILGNGEISAALTVKGCLLSQSAKQKIEAAGGTVE
ncbi:MAG: 50S ribosomal protein L15 [Deltaproteobacteria bacterium]|nr:MAG: 50S ribosomal protein L15 [Deltaproteobacteria bacterium]